MTSDRKRRAARRKLAAHDRGENRHNKGAAWMFKRNRLAETRERERSTRRKTDEPEAGTAT